MKNTYIKGIDINTINIGDKIWFAEPFHDREIGIVSRVEDTWVWAKWGKSNSNRQQIEEFINVENNYDEIGCSYGTVKEEEIEVNKTSNKHPYYAVIVHWASGGEIESAIQNSEKWVPLSSYVNTPNFNATNIKWRIKPNFKEIRYRTAMLKNHDIVVMYSEPTLEDAYGEDGFLKWLDAEWNVVKVEY